jgi:hypothetical protein
VNFVVQVDIFSFSGNWVFHVTRGLVHVVRISEVDIIPVTFESVPVLVDLFIDVGGISINVIGRESISWFGNFFVFNVVNSKRSVTMFLGLGPITIFRDTG